MKTEDPCFWLDITNYDNGALSFVKKKKERQKVKKERREKGFAYLDWINFDHYTGYLREQIIKHVLKGHIPVTDEGYKTIQTFQRDIQRNREQVKALYEDVRQWRGRNQNTEWGIVCDADDWELTLILRAKPELINGDKTYKELAERTKVLFTEQQEHIIPGFNELVLPQLPFWKKSGRYTYPKADRSKGLAEADYEHAGTFYVHIMIDGLRRFADSHGYASLNRNLTERTSYMFTVQEGFAYQEHQMSSLRYARAVYTVAEGFSAFEGLQVGGDSIPDDLKTDFIQTWEEAKRVFLLICTSLWD